MACHGSFYKKERSNDVILHHTTPCVHFWCVPLMYCDLMRWLPTPNSAVLLLTRPFKWNNASIGRSYWVQKTHHCPLHPAFVHKMSSWYHGLWYADESLEWGLRKPKPTKGLSCSANGRSADKPAFCMHVNINIGAHHRELQTRVSSTTGVLWE
jgi:hypothetical protein